MPTITLYERDLLPLDSGPRIYLDMRDRIGERQVVKARVKAEVLPVLDGGVVAIDRVTIYFRENRYDLLVSNWNYTSRPITGSRWRDANGQIQTEVLRRELFYSLEGRIQLPEELEEAPSSESSEIAFVDVPDAEWVDTPLGVEEAAESASMLPGYTDIREEELEELRKRKLPGYSDPKQGDKLKIGEFEYIYNGKAWILQEKVAKSELKKKKSPYSRKLRIRKK